MIPAPSLTILDEQDAFLVVHKPAGVAVHKTSIDGPPTLIERLRLQRADPGLHPAHRLDAVTSGLLLVAKGLKANRALSRLFASREISKYYLALSAKKPSKKQGLIKGDMLAARNGSWKLARSQRNPAVTQFFSYGLGDGLRLFALKPHTGKTHQLRVALKSLAAPILGDDRYGGEAADRCYLHAYQLSFTWEGKLYRYSCLPDAGGIFQADLFRSRVTALGCFDQLPWPAL